MLTQEAMTAIKSNLPEADERLLIIFDALSDPSRHRIFQIVMMYHDICVTEMAEIFTISIPAASYHLKILERAGLIKRLRMKQMICYELRDDDPVVRTVVNIIEYEFPNL